MILSANQPYFLPYIGYWQLINQADIFVISDNIQYIQRGWINRNRLLLEGKPVYFNVEISFVSRLKNIDELFISEELHLEKKRKQLFFAYHNAPYYEAGMNLFERIFAFEDKNLARFLENSIRIVCEYLDIQTKIVRSSDLPGNELLKKEQRIFDFCERLGADTYINAIGGQELYSYEEFSARGLKLGFIKTGDVRYKQFNQEFVPSLSILDVIMFNDKDSIREMLGNYTIISEETQNS